MGKINTRLAELGIALPTPAKPVANYVPWVRTGNLVFISGQGAMSDGKILYQGRLPDAISHEDALKSARLCAASRRSSRASACRAKPENSRPERPAWLFLVVMTLSISWDLI